MHRQNQGSQEDKDRETEEEGVSNVEKKVILHVNAPMLMMITIEEGEEAEEGDSSTKGVPETTVGREITTEKGQILLRKKGENQGGEVPQVPDLSKDATKEGKAQVHPIRGGVQEGEIRER